MRVIEHGDNVYIISDEYSPTTKLVELMVIGDQLSEVDEILSWFSEVEECVGKTLENAFKRYAEAHGYSYSRVREALVILQGGM